MKALDTVNPIILLSKLQSYGIWGLLYEWVKGYLSEHQQNVAYDFFCYPKLSVVCGVPQVSILGSLIFIVYVNDLCNISQKVKFILFEDDTNIFLSHEKLSTIECIVNSEFVEASKWLKANRLS